MHLFAAVLLTSLAFAAVQGYGCGGLLEGDAGQLEFPIEGNADGESNCLWIIKLISGTGIRFTLNRISAEGVLSLYPEHEATETVLMPIRLDTTAVNSTVTTTGQVLVVVLAKSSFSTGIEFTWESDATNNSPIVRAASYVDTPEGRISWTKFGQQERLTWGLGVDPSKTLTIRTETEFARCEAIDPCQCSYFAIYEVTPEGYLREATRVCGRPSESTIEQLYSQLVAFVYVNSTAVSSVGSVEITWIASESDVPTTTTTSTTTTTTTSTTTTTTDSSTTTTPADPPTTTTPADPPTTTTPADPPTTTTADPPTTTTADPPTTTTADPPTTTTSTDPPTTTTTTNSPAPITTTDSPTTTTQVPDSTPPTTLAPTTPSTDIELGCGGIINVTTLSEVTVRYKLNERYNNGEFCVWSFKPNFGVGWNQVTVELLQDGFEAGQDGLEAYYDQEPTTESTNLSRCTFNNATRSCILRNGLGFLTFSSNIDGSGTGFRAKISMGDTNELESSATFYHTNQGNLTYPINAANYRYSERHLDVIQVNVGHTVHVNSVNTEMFFDTVSLYNLDRYGSNINFGLEGRWSGDLPDGQAADLTESSYPRVVIFKSDSSTNLHGYSLAWKTTGPAYAGQPGRSNDRSPNSGSLLLSKLLQKRA